MRCLRALACRVLAAAGHDRAVARGAPWAVALVAVGVAVLLPVCPTHAKGRAAIVETALAQGRAAIVEPALAGAPWSPDGVAKLQADLDALIANAKTLRGAHVGVYVVDARRAAPLYGHLADDEFQPASTLKLLVGSAALERLGAQFRFHSTLVATPSSPSSLAYDTLVFRAGGDPLLTTDDFADAARAVGRAGIGPVRGVAIDDSHFDALPYPRGWTWDDFGQAYAPRVSAMALEENLVHLVVTPGAAAGEAAFVRAKSVADTRASAQSCNVASLGPVDVVARAATGTATSADTLDVALDGRGCIEVIGSLPAGAPPEDLDAAVPDPLAYARAALVASLRNAGIGVAQTSGDARLRLDPAQPNRTLWVHDSQALAAVLGPRFWIPSDNLFGEVLLKELGFAAVARPGTTEDGIAAEKLWLRSIGVDPSSVTLADGCGMSQYDRITPRALVAILQHDWNGPNRSLILDSLPVGGARGTIEGIAGTPVAGRVFAKTGSIMHVRALAGYLATVRHGALTFAFNVDDWNGDYDALAAVRAQVLARIVTD